MRGAGKGGGRRRAMVTATRASVSRSKSQAYRVGPGQKGAGAGAGVGVGVLQYGGLWVSGCSSGWELKARRKAGGRWAATVDGVVWVCGCGRECGWVVCS